MKKINFLVLLFVVCLMGSQVTTAQSLSYTSTSDIKSQLGKRPVKNSSGGDAFGEGKFIAAVGYGALPLGLFYKTVLNNYVDVNSSYLGPIFFKMEYGITDKVSMGLNINYSKFKASFATDDTKKYTGDFSYNSPSVILRSNFHFGTSEKLDPYWGVGLGYRRHTISYKDNDPNTVDEGLFNIPFGFTFEAGIGLRYFFTPNLGAYVEAGITRTPIQLGVVGSF